MATRTVNVKFVITLGAVVLAVSGGGVGYALWRVSQNHNPDLLKARADKALAAGKRSESLDLYRLAFRYAHEQRNPSAAILADTIATMRFDDTVTQPEAYREALAFWKSGLLEDPLNKECLSKLTQEYFILANYSDSGISWGEVEKNAGQLVRVDPTEPKPYVILGNSIYRQLLPDDHGGDRFAQVEGDFRKAVEVDPNNLEALQALSSFELIKADDLDKAMKQEEAKKLRASALGRLKEFKEKNPTRSDARLAYASALEQVKDLPSALAELQAAAAAMPKDDKVFDALAYFYSLPDKEARNPQEMENALAKVVELNPARIDRLLALGDLYDRRRETDKAIDAYQKILNSKGSVKGIESSNRLKILELATNNLCWEYLDKAAIADPGTSDRKEALAKANGLIEQIQRTRPSDVVVQLFKGRIKMLDREYGSAGMLLKQADAVYSSGRNVGSDNWRRTKLLLVEVYDPGHSNQIGDAIKVLNELLAVYKNNPLYKLQRAQMENILAQYKEAYNDAIETIPYLGDKKEIAQRLALSSADRWLNSGLIKQNERQGVKDNIDKLRHDLGNDVVSLGAIQDLLLNGDSASALALLNPVLKQKPDDMQAQWLTVIASMAQATKVDSSHAEDLRRDARKYLEGLLKKYPNETRFKIQMARLDHPDATNDEIVKDLINALPEEYDRNMAWAAFHANHGNLDEQLKSLKAAETLKPDDSVTVDRIFQVLLLKKDWEDAQRYQQKAEIKNIDGVNGKFYQGQLELARERVGAAIATLKAAVALRSDFSMGQTILGQAYLANGQIAEALDAYTKARDQSPNNVTALKGLIKIYVGMRDPASLERAGNLLRSALEYQPRDRELRAYQDVIGDIDDAIKRREAQKQADPTDIDNLQRLAIVYLRKANTPEKEGMSSDELNAQKSKFQQKAMEVYKPVYDKYADNIIIADQYARLLREAGNTDQAIQVYQKFITNDKQEVRFVAYLMLGDTQRGVRQLKEAEQYYRLAIKEKPKADNTEGERKLGDMLFETEQYGPAEEIYKVLVADTEGKDPRVLNRYIEALVRQGKFDVAETLLTGVLKNNSKDQEAMVLLGYLRMSQRKVPESLKVFGDILAANPNNLNARYYRALVDFTTQSDVENGILDLQQIRKLDPSNTKALALLARMFRQSGKVGDAVEEYKEILGVDPTIGSVRLEYAEFLMGLARQARGIPANNNTDYAQLLRTMQPEQLVNDLLIDSYKRFPTQLIWQKMLGDLAAMTGHDMQALQIYEKIWQDQDRSADASLPLLGSLLKAKRYEDVVKFTTEMMQKTPNLLDLWVRRADAYAGELQQDKAIDDFQHALDGTVNNASGYMMVVADLGAALKPEVAIEVLKKRLEANPKHIPTRLAIAQLQLRLGDTATAAETARPMLDDPEAKPLKPMLLKIVALAAYKAGKFPEAVENYKTLVSLVPDDIESINNLAYILSDDLKRPADGLPYAEQAVKILKLASGETVMLNNGNVYDTLGWVRYLNGDLAGAYQALNRSVTTDPAPLTHYHLALVLKAQKKIDQAKQEAQFSVDMAKAKKDDVLPKAEALLQELGG